MPCLKTIEMHLKKSETYYTMLSTTDKVQEYLKKMRLNQQIETPLYI